MSLVNIQPWLLRAQRESFAVGAFNANTLEQVQAIVAAAEAERAPVILQISHRALLYVGNGNSTLGVRYMAHLGILAAESVSVPVGLHLDHAPVEEIQQAMALGFTSLMFDSGALDLSENTRVTRMLREQAHQLGIGFEGELGRVARQDASGHASTGELTDPVQAAEFVRATGVDSLAIAIGSIHAVQEKTVLLDLKRLEAIRAQVDVPLVLHGSSGVTDDSIASGIALGLCKVNVATQLNQAFTRALRETLAQSLMEVDPRQYLRPARQAMTERVRERIRFLGSTDKAE